MNQKEKRNYTRKKILDAALKEFSSNTYDKSSINRICENGNIAKGVMYHYFKNKEDLYFYCVKYCYSFIAEYYKKSLKESINWESCVENYFRIRYNLFIENPEITKVFFYTMLQENENFIKEMKNIKQELENITHNFFVSVLNKMELRKDITAEEIISIVRAIENMLYHSFKNDSKNLENVENLIFKYEESIKKYANILLYGILNSDSLNKI